MRSILAKSLTTSAGAILAVFAFASPHFAQSSLPDHPTPITRNEIEATVKARDIGDARLTTHYYWFEGAQGDVFINWTSKNFAGDVDLFIQNGLRSLTKIVVYADFGEVETGRVIYLRKPERLLLRVQGRTPNDSPAAYRLKFAGSFVAATADEKDVPMMPSVGENVAGAVRVNSVGTILPPLPKPVETKNEPEARKAATEESAERNKSEFEKQAETKPAVVDETKEAPKLEVVVEDSVNNTPVTKSTAKAPPRRNRSARNSATKQSDPKVGQVNAAETPKQTDLPSKKNDSEARTASKNADESNEPTTTKSSSPPVKIDPLANVQLVIMFKDGSRIERPLPEVFRFTVDRGVLTVISKDGRVGKYQMVSVARVTIE